MRAEVTIDPPTKAQIGFDNFPCDSCAVEAEKLLLSLEGVIEIFRDPAVERICVTFDPEKVGVPSLLSTLGNLGLKARVVSVIIPMR